MYHYPNLNLNLIIDSKNREQNIVYNKLNVMRMVKQKMFTMTNESEKPWILR